jgi:hypothetical protein
MVCRRRVGRNCRRGMVSVIGGFTENMVACRACVVPGEERTRCDRAVVGGNRHQPGDFAG